MIAIALPMTLLLACGGGGGGGGTAATGTPPTNMPGTNDPNTPPANMPDPNTPPTITLPGYALDASTAQTRVGGTAPTNMIGTQIVTAIQTRATAADTFEFSDFGPTANAVTTTCSNTDKSCSGTIPDVEMLTFSLAGIEDLSLVDGDMNLVDFDSETEAVMVDRGVTLIQSQAAARQNDGTRLTFQTYGGWLDDSVFGVQILGVTEDGTTTDRFASFSFGKARGSRPFEPDDGHSPVRWNGSMVGVNTDKHIIQGDLEVIADLIHSNERINSLLFSNIVNITNGVSLSNIEWVSVTIDADGTFSSTAGGDVDGAFYGTEGREVSGTFNRDGIIGAFGGTR